MLIQEKLLTNQQYSRFGNELVKLLLLKPDLKGTYATAWGRLTAKDLAITVAELLDEIGNGE